MNIEEYITIAIQSAKTTKTEVIFFDIGVVVDAGELFIAEDSNNRVKFSIKMTDLTQQEDI